MRPVLLPLAGRLGRAMLRRRGFASVHVETEHGPMHTYDARGAGELPTTVVLHGLGAAATEFGQVFLDLQRHVRRVVAPEYPGHGFSAGARRELTPRRLFESLTTVLDTHVFEPAILVGNSLGGALALRYALARPDRVRALVLVSPAGAPSSLAEWEAIKQYFDVRSRADAMALLQRIYHRPPWFTSLFAHEFPWTLGTKAVRDLLEHASNADLPSPEEIASLQMPVLLVWGQSERLFPSSHLEYFARYLPRHAVIERPAGFGHCPHFEAPHRLAHTIVGFVRTRIGAA